MFSPIIRGLLAKARFRRVYEDAAIFTRFDVSFWFVSITCTYVSKMFIEFTVLEPFLFFGLI